MTQKLYFMACGSVFLVVAAAHLARLITGWEVSVAAWSIPRWISVPGFIVPGLLSAWGFMLASRVRPIG